MTPTSLAVAFRTGKIIKNWLRVFERGENCYKIVYYTLWLDSSESSEIALQS